MAYLDTVLDWLDKGSNVLNAAQPFLRAGGAWYNNNQTQDAIGDSFDAYKGYADKSLNALTGVYKEGKTAIKPYMDFGKKGVSGYNALMANPASLAKDPGYQWRRAQGEEATTRALAKNRQLGSGNRLTALEEYGQGFASSEFDKALERYLPMIQTGTNANNTLTNLGRNYSYGVTGVNQALGEAAGGAEIGSGRANSRMVTDFLGMTGGAENSFGTAADTLRNGRDAISGLNELTNAGNGNPIAAVTDSLPGSGNEWARAAGPRESARMPSGSNVLTAGAPALSGGVTAGSVAAMNALGGAGTAAGVVGAPVAAPFAGGFQMQGTVAAMDALGAGAAPVATTAGTTTGAAAAAGQSGALTGGAAFGAYVAAPVAIILALNKFKNFKGGAAEGAKLGKFSDQLQRDMQADPTGRTAQATLGRLVNGQLWPGEANGWVVGTMLKDGVLGLNSPLLYSKQSKFNPFDTKAKTDTYALGSNIEMLSYGIPPAQAERYAKIQTAKAGNESRQRAANEASDTGRGRTVSQRVTPEDEQFLKQIESKLTPENRLRTATRTRAEILAANPNADVTKLDKFIRSNT